MPMRRKLSLASSSVTLAAQHVHAQALKHGFQRIRRQPQVVTVIGTEDAHEAEHAALGSAERVQLAAAFIQCADIVAELGLEEGSGIAAVHGDDTHVLEVREYQPAEPDFPLPFGVAEMSDPFAVELGAGILEKGFPFSFHHSSAAVEQGLDSRPWPHACQYTAGGGPAGVPAAAMV